MGRLRDGLLCGFAVLVLLGAVIAAGLSFRPHAGESDVLCVWEDGARLTPYAEAYSAVCGVEEDGTISLRDGTRRGYIETGEAFRAAVEILRTGTLSELYLLDMGGLKPIEHAAIMAEFGRDTYYADGTFCIRENAVRLTADRTADRVSLLAGSFPAGYLKMAGATVLRVCAEAEVGPGDLKGSAVVRFLAEPPYVTDGSALYLDTPGGRRLIAAAPKQTELTVGACDFLDTGALSPCEELVSLTLPVLRGAAGEGLRELFETSDGHTMPETLAYVTVLHGIIADQAFYGCTLKKVDLSGILPEDLSPHAFDGAAVETVVCTRGDLALSGYRVTAQGGLYLYERSYEREETKQS